MSNKRKILKNLDDAENVLIRAQKIEEGLMNDDKLDPTNRINAARKAAEIAMLLFRLRAETENHLESYQK